MSNHLNTEAKSARWGGVFLSILGILGWQDLTKTVVLATVGTVVSYFVSALLKKLCSWYRKR